MTADDVVGVYRRLADAGIRVWIQGGWGIDALLGQQTRAHKDLDLLASLDDLELLNGVLAEEGFELKYVWPENLWIELAGKRVATAFVVADSRGRELDFHVAQFQPDGAGVPAWESDRVFTPSDLSGMGRIASADVRCYSPEMQMSVHTGYELPSEQADDLRLLHEMLGVDYPEGHANRAQPRS